MTTLRARIAGAPGLRIESASGRWCGPRLLEHADEAAAAARGRSVALATRDAGIALALLAALDGSAARVLLAGPGHDEATRAALAAQAGCDATLGGLRDLEGASDRDPPAAGTEWLLATSGTSGYPKLVAHRLATLMRRSRPGHPEAVWGLLYDWSRFAGLQVLLQAVASGATLVAPPADAPLDERLARLLDHGCTHLSATPTLWRQVLMTPGAERLPLVQVTLGGEIADDRILRALATTWPRARVTHVYASTEAGVGFSVQDGRAGFPAAYLDGQRLRVADGRLQVRHPGLDARYVGGAGFGGDDGWIDTGDAVAQDGERVRFLGRASGVVNVGGNKVHPETVEQVLLTHPDVAQARVFARANPIMGAVVAAEVVLADGASPPDARQRILAHARGALARHEVPAVLSVVAALDANAGGKLARKPLP